MSFTTPHATARAPVAVPVAQGRRGLRTAALVPALSEVAGRVMTWALSSQYSRAWVDPSLDAEANLQSWALLDGAAPYVLVDGDVPVAYGEVWLDAEEDEAELAHLVVDPARRRRGWGRELVLRLAELAACAATHVVLRVEPDNTLAQRVYQGCGFRLLPTQDQDAFNAGQPRRYVWMRRR